MSMRVTKSWAWVEAELVQISTRSGTIEIHAMLFWEQRSGEPFIAMLDAQLDRLSDEINPQTIWHVYGGQLLAAQMTT